MADGITQSPREAKKGVASGLFLLEKMGLRAERKSALLRKMKTHER